MLSIHRLLLACAALLSALLLAPSVRAQEAVDLDLLIPARAADIAQVMDGRMPADAVFSARFLAEIPASKLSVIAADLAASHGPLLGADEVRTAHAYAGRFILRYARARADAEFQLSATAPYLVEGFLISRVSPLDDGPARILEDFSRLPGSTALSVKRLGHGAAQPVLSLRPGMQLAVGSAFKLWVLDALAEDIAAGRHRWNEVALLDRRSLPSGIMQDWPDHAPVTVETLATLMISHSDNTATDMLIHLIGRARIEARVLATGHAQPSGMVPLLTTLEAFALKSSHAGDGAEYALASESRRRQILARLADRLDPAMIDRAVLDPGRPNAIDRIEWFASCDDIIGVLDSLHQRRDPRVAAILAVNPQVPLQSREKFRYVGYKGGSETGVIAMSWLVQNHKGAWFAVAASWNNTQAAVDNGTFELLARRLVELVD